MRYPASEKLEIIRLVEIRHQGRRASGTASLTQYANGSLNWLWTSPSYHRGNWPRASPIRQTTLCRNLSNLTPADVYFGRGPTILLERERIKRNTIQKRRLQHQKKAA